MRTTMSSPTPMREIRASYDSQCIVVYQAYNQEIASAAVREQKLSASSSFRLDRMTWIKPSWCWMLYRSGYSYKDEHQARILAIRIKHDNFLSILRRARPTDMPKPKGEESAVLVQWDPERSFRIDRMESRSLQVGIRPVLIEKYVEEWIESIEDVTEKARKLKKRLDEDLEVEEDALIEEGLLPVERVYDIPEDILERLETK